MGYRASIVGVRQCWVANVGSVHYLLLLGGGSRRHDRVVTGWVGLRQQLRRCLTKVLDLRLCRLSMRWVLPQGLSTQP